MGKLSQAQLMGYGFEGLLVLLVGLAILFRFLRRSGSVETGHYGAVGLGVGGYLWGGILFPVVILAMIGNLKVFVTMKNNWTPAYLLFVAVFNGLFTIIAYVWGLYLTNQKQHSYYRSALVGAGYGFANGALSAGMQIYNAYLIQSGQAKSGQVVSNIVAKKTFVVLAEGITYGALIVFFTAMGFLLAKYMLQKETRKMFLIGIACFGGCNFVQTAISKYCFEAASPYVRMVILVAVAVFAALYMKKELFDGEELLKAPKKEF